MQKINEKLLEKYPWISFEINLRELSFSTWMLLGQCVSKCDHIKRIPLSPAVRKELHKVYLIKGVVATTAIEGNTLTEEQVRNILDNKANIEPSKKYLEQEVKNIIEACNEIGRNIRSEKHNTVSNELICELNKSVLANVPVEDGAISGDYRNRQVGVGRYRAPAAQDVSPLMDSYCEWLNAFDGTGIDEIAAAIIKAIAAHINFVLIHPFDDGNGRTARLLEFMILLLSGVPSPAAHLLSNHYNATRAEYYRHLDKISKTKGDMRDFFAYAIQGLRDGLQDVIDTIIVQVQMVSWRHYVYQIFKPIENDSAKRQREILFLLSECAKPLPLSEIEKLTAKYYLDKGKTKKSFTRDWNSLLNTELIVVKNNEYEPNYSLILNQLPFSM